MHAVSRMAIHLIAASIAVTASADPGERPLLDPDTRPIVTIEHRPPGPHPVMGPRLAPVTIEFFANVGDGASTSNAHRWLVELAVRHPTRLRIVYRLTGNRRHTSPHLEFAHEAFVQGRFFEFLDAFYGNRNRTPRVSAFEDIARRSGVDYQRVLAAREDGRHAEVFTENYYYRQRYGVSRVPGILVNGTPLSSRIRSLGQLEHIYDAAYARARTLLDTGVPLADLHARLLRESAARRAERVVAPGAIDGLDPGEELPEFPTPIPARHLENGPHRRGPDDADVVVHFFCHFQSRGCIKTFQDIRTLEHAYPDEVRLVFHHLFDPADDSQAQAPLIAEATECAAEQDSFWPFVTALHRRARLQSIGPEFLVDVAAAAGLEIEGFEACLGSGRQTQGLEAAIERARLAGVRHTPTVVIGGMAYPGTLDFEDLRTLVDRELAPGLIGRLSELPTARD